ncbi:hypothetical protein LCI18_014928 [Fusarium solani-melongenae]|uniref:Uncharacterized protein n=1 Tax=Fusarium solani subsp. cucurbitae TaxID=2747967 RepID=A0ACD3ZSC7_FUSSC|nr:hypothetical protein LCI18_014928 [Fusarium solani-melongenae]
MPHRDLLDDVTTYNDKYVVLYDFGEIDRDTAVEEFKTLLVDLEEAGLDVEVRAGYEQTLLIFVKAPRELLGNTVYKSRVKDWLYGITPNHPGGDKNTVVDGAYEAEDILSLYHLINWPKTLGGAGITPGLGKWENVKAIFPLHNPRVNQALLRHLSKRIFLTPEDIDSIRDILGSKVAFYFAFIQTYLLFLTFPAITGVIAWLWLPRYSLAYGILTSIWCTVFLEYWKIQEVDLSLRWNVKGIQGVKVNRPQFKYDSVFVDGGGRKHYYFPRWKKVTRQLLQIPFLLFAFFALGVIIIAVFGIEVLISETYAGPYKYYLEYLPTILLAVSLPYITSALEDAATWMTEFENHRTADHHEMSLTQKIFLLNVFTNYLPILLTAFIYIPFGDNVVPRLENILRKALGSLGKEFVHQPFTLDADRLRNEVIALTVTGQISSFFEENIVPMLKHRLSGWYRDYRRAYSKGDMLLSVVQDDPQEAKFLARCRNQATLPGYNVQDDISEIVLQFGYLALFSPVWPIIPMGFLINNWIELRSDFAKISLEHQRPAPVRSDGIGPWIYSLEALTWLGSICTAAIVHLFSFQNFGDGTNKWVTLPITVFISEHVLLLLRTLVRFVLQQIGSERIREDYNQRYANRVKHLEEIESNKRAGLGVSEAQRERRRSILATGRDVFWTKQVEAGASETAGVSLIKQVKKEEKTEDPKTENPKTD